MISFADPIRMRRGRYRWRTWAKLQVPLWINLVFLGVRTERLLIARIPRWRDVPRRALLKVAARLFRRGRRDCGRHEWRYSDGEVQRCYHCTVGERRVPPERRAAWSRARELAAARRLYVSDPEFRADVDEERVIAEEVGVHGDSLLIMLWHSEREGHHTPRRARRRLREAG